MIPYVFYNFKGH